MRRASVLLLVLAGMALPARAASHDVTVDNFSFSPRQVVAAPGDTVTWTWAQGAFTHNVTAEVGDDFQSPDQSSGTFTAAFKGGTVLYRCTFHSAFTPPATCRGMCAAITEDTVAPLPPTIEQPIDGSTLETKLVTFSGGADPEATTVRLTEAGGTLDEVPAIDARWSTTVLMPNGTHVVDAVAVDLALNESAPARVTFTVHVDTEPPTIEMTSPRFVGIFTDVAAFRGLADDDLAVERVSVILLDALGNTIQVPAVCTGCGTMHATWLADVALDDGVYRARATVADTAGKTATTSDVVVAVA